VLTTEKCQTLDTEVVRMYDPATYPSELTDLVIASVCVYAE